MDATRAFRHNDRRVHSRAIKVGDKVRLVADQDGVPAGTVGVVHGFYRDQETERVALSVDGQSLTVGSERLELVEDDLSPTA
jgi:hypothetical protein